MGLYKLREWVGTVTGKGDRWGRDRIGRSAPAFLAASTTALPPPTCAARREAGRHPLAAAVFAARPANCWLLCFLRPVPGEESVGCVRLQWPCSAGCVPARLCHAIPTALLNVLAPIHFALFAPCSFHVRQDRRCNSLQAARTVLLAAATRACSGGPCAGSICDSFFFLQSS